MILVILLVKVSLFILPPHYGILARSATIAQHYTDISWEDLTNPSGTAYNVYKAPGPCGYTTIFNKIASNIASGPAGLSYRDYDVVAGTIACYYVTAANAGEESAHSSHVQATTPSP